MWWDIWSEGRGEACRHGTEHTGAWAGLCPPASYGNVNEMRATPAVTRADSVAMCLSGAAEAAGSTERDAHCASLDVRPYRYV